MYYNDHFQSRRGRGWGPETSSKHGAGPETVVTRNTRSRHGSCQSSWQAPGRPPGVLGSCPRPQAVSYQRSQAGPRAGPAQTGKHLASFCHFGQFWVRMGFSSRINHADSGVSKGRMSFWARITYAELCPSGVSFWPNALFAQN